MAYVAQYSPRTGAASYRWKDDVEVETKKRRLYEINQLLQQSATLYNQKLIGRKQRVLITGTDRKPGFLKGLTEGKINVRVASNQLNLVGQFTRATITRTNGLSLEGELEPVRVTSLSTD
jgi:tRNA-2-methylthio-N6-dimethylallyladenosine synthase